MLKSRVLAVYLTGFSLVWGGIAASAQNRIPQRVDPFGEFFVPPVPPMPPMPPMPEVPPVPPIPPIPQIAFRPDFDFNFDFGELPEFHFEFGGGLQAGFAGSADPEVRIQQEVFRALLRNSPDRAIEVATERLKADPSDPVVLPSLSAIVNSNSSKALPLLVSIAKTSPSAAARREAILGITRGPGDKDAILTTVLDVMSSSRDEETIRAATGALAEINTARSLKALTDIVQDKARPMTVRQSALGAARRNSGFNLAMLEGLYNASTDSTELRQSIVSSISRTSDPRTTSVLAKIATIDPEISVRRTAVQYLGSRKDSESMKALEDLLKAAPRTRG